MDLENQPTNKKNELLLEIVKIHDELQKIGPLPVRMDCGENFRLALDESVHRWSENEGLLEDLICHDVRGMKIVSSEDVPINQAYVIDQNGKIMKILKLGE